MQQNVTSIDWLVCLRSCQISVLSVHLTKGIASFQECCLAHHSWYQHYCCCLKCICFGRAVRSQCCLKYSNSNYISKPPNNLGNNLLSLGQTSHRIVDCLQCKVYINILIPSGLSLGKWKLWHMHYLSFEDATKLCCCFCST